jgi:hypothetical protein
MPHAAVSVEERLAVTCTMRSLATGDSHTSLQYLVNISKQEIGKIIPEAPPTPLILPERHIYSVYCNACSTLGFAASIHSALYSSVNVKALSLFHDIENYNMQVKEIRKIQRRNDVDRTRRKFQQANEPRNVYTPAVLA